MAEEEKKKSAEGAAPAGGQGSASGGEELEGTKIIGKEPKTEGEEVEDLIKEALKAVRPKEAPPPEEKKAEEVAFKATPVRKETPPPPPPPEKVEEKPKEAALPPPTYEETFKKYKVGDIVSGTVLKVDPGGVLVDIGYKADGLILPDEISEKSFTTIDEVVKVGDKIEVYIENLEDKEGHVVLSKEKADYEKKWNMAYEAYKTKKVLEANVTSAVKGGLVVDCEGIRGFIPASQVAKKADVSLEEFVGKNLPIKIIQINRRQGKVVLSHKLAAGEKQKWQVDKLLNELEVGQVRHGIVTSIKNFGAFVDIGGVEGLIHISELSWKRVKHPSEMLSIGDETDVFVLGVDKADRKVALGLKELQPDPWVQAAELYEVGDIIKGKVSRLARFGAFIELEKGLEGLVHLTELSQKKVEKPEEAVKVGDEVKVKVLRVLPEEQKIGLSIKGVLIQAEKEKFKEYKEKVEEEKKGVTIGDIIEEKKKVREKPAEGEEGAEPAGGEGEADIT